MANDNIIISVRIVEEPHQWTVEAYIADDEAKRLNLDRTDVHAWGLRLKHGDTDIEDMRTARRIVKAVRAGVVFEGLHITQEAGPRGARYVTYEECLIWRKWKEGLRKLGF